MRVFYPQRKWICVVHEDFVIRWTEKSHPFAPFSVPLSANKKGVIFIFFVFKKTLLLAAQ
jgi:hypothetical protein